MTQDGVGPDDHSLPLGPEEVGSSPAMAPEAGATLAGSSVESLPASQQDIAEPVQEVVQAEGLANQSHNGERIFCWLFAPDVAPRRVSTRALPDIVTHDENFVWVDASEYAPSSLRDLATLLHIHRRIVRMTLSPWHRPRLDLFQGHFFVSVTVPRLDPAQHRIFATELDLAAGNNFLLSAHKSPLPFAETIQARAAGSPELIQLDSAFMLYIVLDELLNYYEDLSEHVQSEVETAQLRALRHTSDDFLEHLVELKRYVFALSHLANQHRDVFAAFLRPDFPFVGGEEVIEYFEDLESRLDRLLDTMNDANDAVTDAFNIYVSHVSQQTNQVIKLLTMVSTVLLPATVIISVFGTNLAISLHGVPLNTPVGVIVMLLSILVVSGGTLAIFHHRGWI